MYPFYYVFLSTCPLKGGIAEGKYSKTTLTWIKLSDRQLKINTKKAFYLVRFETVSIPFHEVAQCCCEVLSKSAEQLLTSIITE